VLGGGLSILYTLAVHFGIEALHPARGALRQGVIFDLDERLDAARSARHQDMRDASVQQLQHRFAVDTSQAERVQALALALYAQAWPEADLETVRELGWAAALHELGMMVSHHDHHRHSAYLLGHVDAPGFSQSQQRRLGELVLAQRGGLRKMEVALAQTLFAWQALCLRLAIILCHARSDVDPSAVALRRAGGSATLRLEPPWAEAHPRTLHLLNEEVDTWARSGVLRLALRRAAG
ncbi:MAG TPA: exopolyphosphatase, partial [Methylibium sp.]